MKHDSIYFLNNTLPYWHMFIFMPIVSLSFSDAVTVVSSNVPQLHICAHYK